MKFDNFVKYAGGDGVILTAPDNSKWLFFSCVAMKIPEHKNVCGAVGNMPDYINQLINELEFQYAELVGAYVPTPDSKPSTPMRCFKSNDYSIDITNKHFGFIEKNDRTFITQYEGLDDESTYTALLVTNDYSTDDTEIEIKMIIIKKETE